MVQIDLKALRIIVIEDRGQKYTFAISRIPKKTWLAYFANIISSSENQGGKKIDSYDSTGARVELVESSLSCAAGYPLPEGIESIVALKDWTHLLPMSHRLGIGTVLVSVVPSDRNLDAPLQLGIESVFIDAVWGADDAGKMRKIIGLRHDFKTPTGEQQRRYARDSTRSMVVGGSRSGKTVWIGAQPTLADLYDELIVKVDGYSVDGKTLGDSDRDSIVEYMDTYHKVVAADCLFSPVLPKIEEGND